MKIRKYLVIFSFVFVLLAFTGLLIHPSSENKPIAKKTWIFFKDKGENSKASLFLADHEDYVTELSKERRREKNKPVFTSLDIAVSERYKSEVEKTGAKIQNVSKWLNGVSVIATEEQIRSIKKFHFVKKTEDVAVGRTLPDLNPVGLKILDAKTAFTDSSEDEYDYGVNGESQIKMLGINKLHNIGYTGRGVRLALFDTGLLMTRDVSSVDSSVSPPETTWTEPVCVHSALERVNIITSYDFIKDYPFAGITEGGASDEVRQLDHGTKMLALIAGYAGGELVSPAFGAEFLIAKTEIVDSEIVAEEDNWIRAVEWADSLGADIISSSLGYKEWYPYSVLTGDSTNIAKAANYASDSFGIVVVNSMGNIKNIDIDSPDTMIVSPADAKSVIAVGGIDDNLMHSTVSSTGPTYDMKLIMDTMTSSLDSFMIDLRSLFEDKNSFIDSLIMLEKTGFRFKPNICALSEWPYTVTDSAEGFNYTLGTSGAAALIAGGCALLLQAHPDWDPAMVKKALYNTAYAPYESTEPETTFYAIPNLAVGYGIADFYEAVMFADTDEVHAIESSALLPPFPNPYSISNSVMVIPFELKRTISNLMLYIYTLDGKLVYYSKKTDLLPGVYDSPSDAFTWNGTPSLEGYSFSGHVNPAGDKKVKPGLYIVMLQTGFEKTVKKISIIP
ncbi:MAG: S8 family serine peptidase [bacterium]|nr:S8 family serine peptidase [bacterium]